MTETGNSAGPDEAIWHFDGVSAVRRQPRIEWTVQGFVLRWSDGVSGPYDWGQLLPYGTVDGQTIFTLKGSIGWRLVFQGPPPPDLAPFLPKEARYGHLIDRFGLWRASAALAVMAVAVVLLVMKLPGWIAPFIPQSWENRLGDAIAGDMGGRICETPASRAALDKLVLALNDGQPIRQIAIVQVPMVNAITLPGQRVLIFDELINKAQSSDELAGVLAHELGHVRHRDTTTALVRQLGLSVVLGGLNGDVGGAVNGLLAMSYSREAETAADQFSMDALRKANVSPKGTARFFDMLAHMSGEDRVGKYTSWVASHPASRARQQAFEKSAVKDHGYRPALDAKDWQALKQACKGHKGRSVSFDIF